MNQDIAEGKWTEIKGEIKKMWGDLRDDDLDRAKGDMTAISGLIQQKYGQKKDDISSSLKDIYERFTSKVADATDRAKDSIKQH